VYAALKAIGVKLKPRDQATLMQQAVKRENNEVNYVDLYSKLRGCQDFGQSYSSGIRCRDSNNNSINRESSRKTIE